jgi:DNA polymerase I-like protein with 3'-5' exonuclease and polymerase domains
MPLNWVGQAGMMSKWRGRLFPVNIAGHHCYYYAMQHPTFVLREDRRDDFVNPQKVTFAIDLEQLFGRLEDLPTAKVHDPFDGKTIVRITGTEDEAFSKLSSEMSYFNVRDCGIDIETTALRPYEKGAKILSCAISDGQRAVAFLLDHPQSGWTMKDKRIVWQLLYDFIMYGPKRVAQNTKFEQEWFSWFMPIGVLHADWCDTMAQSHTLDERTGMLNLGTLTLLAFGFDLKKVTNVDPVKWASTPIKDFLDYNALDALWTILLEQKLDPIVEANPKYEKEYQRKLRTAKTLCLSQRFGVIPDVAAAEKQDKLLEEQEALLKSALSQLPEVIEYTHKFGYGEFSPSSNKDVLSLFKDVLKVKGITKSVDDEALSEVPEHISTAPKMILELRQTSKLRSTYLQPIITGKIVTPDKLIHTNYNLMVAVTGRLSSDNPNLQNFPKRKHKEIRLVITSEDGNLMVSLDYGQIEARVIGMASCDKVLVDALWTGFDIHGHWADWLIKAYPKIQDRMAKDYSIPRDDTKKIRKMVRNDMKNGWVFPQFFGSRVESCANNLKIPIDIARDMGDIFWGEFTGVSKWQQKLLDNWERTGYVETLTGRRRRGPMSRNEIINSPIQGTAADIVLDAMCMISEKWQFDLTGQFTEELQPRMNIHDDLTYNFSEGRMEDNILTVAQVMCSSAERFDFINVPIVAEVSVGKNWYDQEEVAIFSSEDFKRSGSATSR